MNKEEILKSIMEIPKIETNNPISTMNSINVDDLMSAIDRLDKVPTYQDLLKENKKYKEVIDKAKEKLIELAKNFKQEEHIGTAYDDDIFYEELFEIFKEVEDVNITN